MRLACGATPGRLVTRLLWSGLAPALAEEISVGAGFDPKQVLTVSLQINMAGVQDSTMADYLVQRREGSLVVDGEPLAVHPGDRRVPLLPAGRVADVAVGGDEVQPGVGADGERLLVPPRDGAAEQVPELQPGDVAAAGRHDRDADFERERLIGQFLALTGTSQDDLDEGRLGWQQLTPTGWEEADRYAMDQLTTEGRTSPYEKEFLRSDGRPVAFDEAIPVDAGRRVVRALAEGHAAGVIPTLVLPEFVE